MAESPLSTCPIPVFVRLHTGYSGDGSKPSFSFFECLFVDHRSFRSITPPWGRLSRMLQIAACSNRRTRVFDAIHASCPPVVSRSPCFIPLNAHAPMFIVSGAICSASQCPPFLSSGSHTPLRRLRTDSYRRQTVPHPSGYIRFPSVTCVTCA
jgi:hypothetical protein